MASLVTSFVKEAVGAALTVVFIVGSGSLVGLFGLAPLVGSLEGAVIMCSAIVLIDCLCGGPKCNPCVSLFLLVLGKVQPVDFLVEVGGQMAGGVIGFPILQYVCNSVQCAAPVGGPAIDLATTPLPTGMISEALSSYLLATAIGLLAFTRIGEYYWVKQPAIAIAIRVIATQPFFTATGPAMNPMLPTTYQLFAKGALPVELEHYLIYWLTALAAAGLAGQVLKSLLQLGLPQEAKKAKKA